MYCYSCRTKETGRIDQVGECKRQSLSHGTQKIKFPCKGCLQRFTNTSQPSCFEVNYIRPMQSMWENCQPQTYSHWMRVCYTYRHNEVLEIVAEAAKICCETANKTLNNITNRANHFVKESSGLKYHYH